MTENYKLIILYMHIFPMIEHGVTYWAVPPPPRELGGRSSTLDTTPGVMADPNNQTKQMTIPNGK